MGFGIVRLETRVTTAMAALEYSGFLKRAKYAKNIRGWVIGFELYQGFRENRIKSIPFEEDKNSKRVLKRIISDKDIRVDLIADRLDLRTREV